VCLFSVGGEDDVDGALGRVGFEVFAAYEYSVEEGPGEQVGDEGMVDVGAELASFDATVEGIPG
jgi:hypothetical protein